MGVDDRQLVEGFTDRRSYEPGDTVLLTELGNPYDAIGVDANGRASIDWGVYGVPETFVVDANGIITYKHIGPITVRSLAEEVLPAIERARRG